MCRSFQTEEDSNIFGREVIAERSNGTGTLLAMRRTGPCLITPTLPPTPAGLSHQQLKRRHIVAAIIHSENSYVATLQRLVNVRFIIYFSLFHFIYAFVSDITIKEHEKQWDGKYIQDFLRKGNGQRENIF